MRRSNRAKPASKIKIPVSYSHGDVKVVYVARLPGDLRNEHKRMVFCMQMALRQLKLLRSPHPAVAAARLQLENCDVSLPTTSTHQEVAQRLAILSYTFEDTVKILAALSNSKIARLTEARFQLTFGQTPKQRELAPVEAPVGHAVSTL